MEDWPFFLYQLAEYLSGGKSTLLFCYGQCYAYHQGCVYQKNIYHLLMVFQYPSQPESSTSSIETPQDFLVSQYQPEFVFTRIRLWANNHFFKLQIHLSGKQVYIDTSSLTLLKSLLEDWYKSNSHWHYGWPMPNKIQNELSPIHFGIPKHTPKLIGTSITRNCPRNSGGYHLCIFYGKPYAGTDAVRLSTHIGSKPAVEVLVMSCTASPYPFKH